MQAFAYCAPAELDTVLRLLADYGSDVKLLAGGQSLLVLLRQRLIAPAIVVDVKRVAGLGELAVGSDGLRIGATVRHAELAGAAAVRSSWPLLAAAAGSIGSLHIRARGTIGGSIAHADPAADLLVAIIALDGRIEVHTSAGIASYAAGDVATGVFETILGPDAVITTIHLPPPPPGATIGFARFALRAGEFPMCQAAVRVTWSSDHCTAARVVVGGAAERPIRLTEVESILTGAHLGGMAVDHVVDAAVVQAESDVRPFADVRGSVRWKRRVAGSVVRRALRQALEERRTA